MYPALAVLQAIEDKVDETLWVGGEGGMEFELINRLAIPFSSIPAAGIHGVGLKSLPSNLWKLFQGIFASQKLLKQFKPDAILYTGGYVAAPMAIAALKYPSVLYVPDLEPGLALKFLSKFASIIALNSQKSFEYFRNTKKCVVTGYPTRKDLIPSPKEVAMKKFRFSVEKPVVFFFGGSKGARSINRAILHFLPRLLLKAQVIHMTGQLDWNEVLENSNKLDPQLLENYRIFPYLHEEMSDAFSASDLVISRAGASTLGELPLFGTPAILIPYPYAWRYQKVNAKYLVDQKAALMVNDENLEKELYALIETLLSDSQKLSDMKNAMKKLNTPDAAIKIGEHILSLYHDRKLKRGIL